MTRPEYFYPDDVIVSTSPSGVRTARLAYTANFGVDTFAFHSQKPVLFEAGDLDTLKALWHKIWLKAREAFRENQSNEFMAKHYPAIAAERASWHQFIADGNEPSIAAWRKSQIIAGEAP